MINILVFVYSKENIIRNLKKKFVIKNNCRSVRLANFKMNNMSQRYKTLTL